MIPKVIHYCWFGGKELPGKVKKYIASWQKHLPDYQIVRWDESNFDVGICPYTEQAYQAKMYAFVSDFVRFYILYHEGGIYMDTDVEVLRPLDLFLTNKMFAGMESDETVNPGLILGAEKGSPLFKYMIDAYKNKSFLNQDGSIDLTTVVTFTTDILRQFGFITNGELQEVCGMTIYPKSYFCPLDDRTGTLCITRETYTIHHYSASWLTESQKFKNALGRIFGVEFLIKLSNIKRFVKGGLRLG